MFAGVAFLALILPIVLGSVGYAQQEEIIARGKAEFLAYCAVCHGTGGKGDGEMAPYLLRQPPNLTELTRKNNGEFPFWRVYEVIDGRVEVAMHGPRTMPIWGDWFRMEQGFSGPGAWIDLAAGRIWQLVVYLESIQEIES